MKGRKSGRGVEFFPVWLIGLYVIIILVISQSKLEFDEEQISLMQTVTWSFIAINISLLLFILPSLAGKRDKIKESLKELEKDSKEMRVRSAELVSLTQVVNMIIIQNICSFVMLMGSVFAALFLNNLALKFAFLISSLLVQASYFLNMLLWLFFIYWRRPELKESAEEVSRVGESAQIK